MDEFIKNEMSEKGEQMTDSASSPLVSSPSKYSLRARQKSTPQKMPGYQLQATKRKSQTKEGNSSNLTASYNSTVGSPSGPAGVTIANTLHFESPSDLSPGSNQQGCRHLADALKRPPIKLQTYGGKPSLKEEIKTPDVSQKSETTIKQSSPSKQIGDPHWLHLEWTDLIGAMLLTVILAFAVVLFQRLSLD